MKHARKLWKEPQVQSNPFLLQNSLCFGKAMCLIFRTRKRKVQPFPLAALELVSCYSVVVLEFILSVTQHTGKHIMYMGKVDHG